MQQQAGRVSRWVREEEVALRLPPDEAGGQRKGAAGVQKEEEGPPPPREATERRKHGASKERWNGSSSIHLRTRQCSPQRSDGARGTLAWTDPVGR